MCHKIQTTYIVQKPKIKLQKIGLFRRVRILWEVTFKKIGTIRLRFMCVSFPPRVFMVLALSYTPCKFPPQNSRKSENQGFKLIIELKSHFEG